MRRLGAHFSFSLQVSLDLFTLVLNFSAKICEHLLVEAYYTVTVHVVLGIPPLFRTHLERSFRHLSQIALTQCLRPTVGDIGLSITDISRIAIATDSLSRVSLATLSIGWSLLNVRS